MFLVLNYYLKFKAEYGFRSFASSELTYTVNILKYVTNSNRTASTKNTECSLDRAIKDAFEFHIQRKSLLRDFSVSFKL